MANIKSAKKRAIQSEKRRVRNVARKTSLKSAVKKVIMAIDNNELEKAKELLREAEAKFARAKNKGVVHANTAARKIGRLAQKVSAATRTR